MDIDFDALGLELDDEQRQKIIDAAKQAHDKDVEGLKAKRDELFGKLKEKDTKLSQYEGIDPERARELEAEAERLREQQLQKDGKEDELFKLRLDRETAPLKSQLEQLQQQLEKREQEITKAYEHTLESGVATAASRMGVNPDVIDLIPLVARQQGWRVEEGQPVLRNNEGEIIRGKSGPITFDEWLEAQRDARPSWFPQPKGSGAPGNRGGKAVTKQFEDMTGAELSDLRKQNPGEYERLRDDYKSRQ